MSTTTHRSIVELTGRYVRVWHVPVEIELPDTATEEEVGQAIFDEACELLRQSGQHVLTDDEGGEAEPTGLELDDETRLEEGQTFAEFNYDGFLSIEPPDEEEDETDE